MINPAGAAPNSPLPLAATPLSQAEANWASGNGNAFNQNYNPQNLINSSNAQYLAINWLFPLPTYPTPLLTLTGGQGVDTSPLIINGTIYAVTQGNQAFALDAATGNVLWNVVLPVYPNASSGLSVGALRVHLHDGNEWFTTANIGSTIKGPTWWISADNFQVYALNALSGKIQLNWQIFTGPGDIAGNSPGAIYHWLGATNVLIDQKRGIAITSGISTNISDTGRCFYRGWNLNVNPPEIMWTSYCTPPQSGSSLGADPNWTVNQVNSMKGAQIFYPGPAYNAGGSIPGTAVVDLKTLSQTQLNATLYDDWGQANQTPACKSFTGGLSSGSTGAGWGSPWLLGTGPTSGLAIVNTNNKDPYAGPCNPGPDLWTASTLAINETTGQWVWGFQANAHEIWDYDCSWWQALGNVTISGVNTQVVWKTCKAGYLFELNAVTGKMIWAWTPPTNILIRCQYCYLLNPLNRTQMTQAFLNPNVVDRSTGTLCTPCTFAFESESAVDPKLNYIYTVSQNAPSIWYYVPPNSTNYRTSGLTASFPITTGVTRAGYNSTAEAIDAATGKMVWSYFIPSQGYRGGMTTSGNVLYLAMSSGDLIMLNAKTGTLVKDLFIGGPLNILPSVGATASGKMQVIVPMSTGTGSWGTAPGNLLSLTLQNIPTATTTTVTTSILAAPSTTTSVTTITQSAASTGFDATTVYGISAVAVIFIIATGFLAMRGRKPGP